MKIQELHTHIRGAMKIHELHNVKYQRSNEDTRATQREKLTIRIKEKDIIYI